MCGWFLPWGCACMQHPVQLVPNPQRVRHCRQPGREDTRTGRGPLEEHRNSWVWSKMLVNTSESICCCWDSTERLKCVWTLNRAILKRMDFMLIVRKCRQFCGEKRERENFRSHLSTVRFPRSPSHSFTDLFKTIERTQSVALLLNTL